MSKARRFWSVFFSVITILMCLILMLVGEEGLGIIMLLFAVWLCVRAIYFLSYYSSLARHMVGGKIILILGFILLNFGLFTLSLSNNHPMYIIVYLTAFYVFSGVVDVMCAFEAKKYKAKNWIWKFLFGVMEVAVGIAAVVAGIVFNRVGMLVDIYAIGVIYSSVGKIINAFQKQEIIYIQ